MRKQKKIKRNEKEVSSSKKKAKILIICAVVATVLLVILNSIDYDKLADKITDNQDDTKQELVTYPDYAFKTPIYDEDIMQDSDYLELPRRFVRLKIGNETNELIGEYEAGTMERFWMDYFDAVMSADSDTLNSLHTDYFVDQNGKYGKFAPQKVYEIKVEIVSSRKVEDGEYAGCYQYFAKVSYNIYENNGTFRNDIKSDESREQIFELIENKNGIKIHTVSYPRENMPTDNEKGFSFMIFIWIALIILSVVIEMMTVSLVAIWFMPAGIVALVLSLFKLHIAIQIGAYLLISIVLLVLSKTVFKNKFVSKKGKEEDDTVIGKSATVTERIDPENETGEVEIDGEGFCAKMTDGGCAEVGDTVTVVRTEGDTLYCERDQSEN